MRAAFFLSPMQSNLLYSLSSKIDFWNSSKSTSINPQLFNQSGCILDFTVRVSTYVKFAELCHCAPRMIEVSTKSYNHVILKESTIAKCTIPNNHVSQTIRYGSFRNAYGGVDGGLHLAAVVWTIHVASVTTCIPPRENFVTYHSHWGHGCGSRIAPADYGTAPRTSNTSPP